ncbi:MAG: hypothetical protein NTX22_08235 [Ignavibacteriales bacterium]|nr:hypothetical protein [Ignavibacteriales bacterium]
MNVRKVFQCAFVFLFVFSLSTRAQRNYNPSQMQFNVGKIQMTMDRSNGSDPSYPLGGMLSQYSWNLTTGSPQNTEIFFWPQDEWQSNILYQIYNPISLDDNGIKDLKGNKHDLYISGDALRNIGYTDWAIETRRYRPPNIVVDGIQLNAPYQWNVDPNLKSDIKIEFEDVLIQFGIRSRCEMIGFANPYLGDFFIWKTTHKFTGETVLPRSTTPGGNRIVDQTIKFWWPLSFSFGPSKAGEKAVQNTFSFEGQDDLDSWFKRKSELVKGGTRDSLYVAYYWDSNEPTAKVYTNGSSDNMGDPDRTTGFLNSTQIPGFTLLYADKSFNQKVDDPNQPYAMPHATISKDLWVRRDVSLKKTYRGDDDRGRFPLDAITEKFSTRPETGPMRFITVGPYELTKDSATSRNDSVTFVYAVGVGGIGWNAADSIGRLWINNEISDSVKDAWVMKGKDSLWQTLDRANWAWNRLNNGQQIPASPPPPDIDVASGPEKNYVKWSYPDPAYFKDAETGVDDWYAWRVYRKRGALLVNDPLDQKSNAIWKLVYETTDRNVLSYDDINVERGVDYYYAVTAVDNGSQNNSGLFTNAKLESSRYVTRSLLPVIPFKPGLSESGKVRVVPNPATVAAGAGLAGGTPDKISFFNLPYKCTLRIFTETGDLIKIIEHQGTADEEWNQRTDNNQYITAGIYILAVTGCQSVDGNNLDDQFVKFVLVR